MKKDKKAYKVLNDEITRLREEKAALLAACKKLINTAKTASETGHTEAEVIAGNWDVLKPAIKSAIKAGEDA